ncbi:hypothetical protein [Hungatella effluvii]|uniref:hypothetical protein n=1 Tax=Hungatella effluvii TaxID=1096246 RepID=UPI0022E15F7F|nr:hypothetical protein [Hungatella effluvii]
MRITKLFFATLSLSFLLTTTAFAGTWKVGTEPNQNKWWYDNDNGTYADNGWQWIDGNNDGVAECYYFDSEGWLLVNTSTPDGYFVNENGAWLSGDVVETKVVTPQDSKWEAKATNDYCGWYDCLNPEDCDIERLGISAFSENSVTLGEFKDEVIYNKSTDGKYYPANGNGYFKYIYFEGDTLIGAMYSGTASFAKDNEASTLFLNESDFIVSGNNSVTRSTSDNSILPLLKNDSDWINTFVEGDSIVTNRGITFPCKKNDILNTYGNTPIKSVTVAEDSVYIAGTSFGMPDVQKVLEANTYVEYSTSTSYKIRFYFNSNDELILIAYHHMFN